MMHFTSFGESHGPAVGGVIEGCPGGLPIDINALREALRRRRMGDTPREGQPPLELMITPRQEPDDIEWLSGIAPREENRVDAALDSNVRTDKEQTSLVTLGTPLAFLLRNRCAQSSAYDALRHCCRPGHADYTYQQRFGLRDWRGGGYASGRETAARVVAGNVALQSIQRHYPVTIQAAYTTPLDGLSLEEQRACLASDTYGGSVRCTILGIPAGIGTPQHDKLNARLAQAMMSIPSATAFEMGLGIEATSLTGRRYADAWRDGAGDPRLSPTLTNHCGGVQGGISNGSPIVFAVHFHAVVTQPDGMRCLSEQGTLTDVAPGGRHDRCHLPRLAVVVESMAALTLAEIIG